MRVVFDERQLAHNPSDYFRRGALVPHPEQPERAVLLRDALISSGNTIVAPADHGREAIDAIHDPAYVDFLLDGWKAWKSAIGSDIAAVPNYHPGRSHHRIPESIIGKLGYYIADTGCPIVEGTAQAVYWSAQSAIDAAVQIGLKRQGFIYALCRPPGHHAYRGQANGFCFLNNAAIAAQILRAHFSRVAIIDIDTHGGNGTQEIFYDRGDVLFASIHVDPSDYPPYYMGYADETGAGGGAGATVNLLLQPGATTEIILDRLDTAISASRAFGAEAMVVSLGFDMSQDDPLSLVRMTGEGFEQAARKLASVNLPTVLVQEGGYLGPSLANNAVRFLDAFEKRREAMAGR